MKLTRQVKEEISRQVNVETDRAAKIFDIILRAAQSCGQDALAKQVQGLKEKFIREAPYLEFKNSKDLMERMDA